MELTKELFDKMRNGKQMVVASMSDHQKARTFPVPLTSFSQSFDGLDNAQYEASRRAITEKLRQRQLEIANKIGLQQKLNVASGGQARPMVPSLRRPILESRRRWRLRYLNERHLTELLHEGSSDLADEFIAARTSPTAASADAAQDRSSHVI